jgi:dTDP-4-dehydrorhamnose reductase
MRVLLTGANGQVGRALAASAPPGVRLVALGRDRLDIAAEGAATRAVAEHAPDVIINAAAYTAVDRAESEPGLALAINGTAVGRLAAAAAMAEARLVQVSTDFVFDGAAHTPYAPDAPTAPLSAYGRSKLAGEHAAGRDALIVRTAWVYAAGGTNFVHTMLRLMRTREEVRVVADQYGAPTFARGLADTIWRLIDQGRTRIWHHTDGGTASWHAFAVAIQEEALALGLLERAVPVIPIATAEYPTPARRPAYSVLDCSATAAALGAPAAPWRDTLRAMLAEVKAHG